MIFNDATCLPRPTVFLLIIINQPCAAIHLQTSPLLSITQSGDVFSKNVTCQAKNEEDSDYQIWLKEKKSLNLHIQTICKKYDKDVKTHFSHQSFMFDSEHNLLFCRNAKVGTSSWLKNFIMISDKTHMLKSGEINGGNLHSTVPKLFKLPTAINNYSDFRNLVENSISFSIVRHPFERLVSAYQDKVIDRRDEHYAYVVMKLKLQYGGVNFYNFVQMVLDDSERICRSTAICGLDKHWRPFISRCGYCDVPYSIIVKAENYLVDQKFLGKMANVTFAELESHVSSGGSTRSLAKKYFAELETNMVKKLYQIYKIDFEMFQYSPDLFINYSKKKF